MNTMCSKGTLMVLALAAMLKLHGDGSSKGKVKRKDFLVALPPGLTSLTGHARIIDLRISQVLVTSETMSDDINSIVREAANMCLSRIASTVYLPWVSKMKQIANAAWTCRVA